MTHSTTDFTILVRTWDTVYCTAQSFHPSWNPSWNPFLVPGTGPVRGTRPWNPSLEPILEPVRNPSGPIPTRFAPSS